MNQKIPQILRAFEGYKGWARDGVKDLSKAIYKLRGVIMHNLALITISGLYIDRPYRQN